MMPRCVDRQAGINAFLNAAGWPPAGRTHLAADCSFRRYERVTGPAGSAVLMDAPPEKEDVRPFITMAERLIAAGYSAPRVLARDTANGFCCSRIWATTLSLRPLPPAVPKHRSIGWRWMC